MESIVWHVVFHKSWDDIKIELDGLKARCDSMVCAEHPADAEVATTHVHIALKGFRSKAARIDKQQEALRKCIPDSLKGRGQYATMSQTQKNKQLYDWNKLTSYILKGNQSYLKFKTDDITTEFIDDMLKAWKNHDEEVRPVSDKKREYTQWTLIEEVRKEGMLTEQLLADGRLENVVIPNKHNWNLMCEKLDKNKIRTSRNELERIWVSIIRVNPTVADEFYEEMMRKLFPYRNI